MDTPIEQRVFEYARGASAVEPDHRGSVVQQAIDLAHGELAVLHGARRRGEQAAEGPNGTEGDATVALLEAAIEKVRRERGESEPSRSEPPPSRSPEQVVAFVLRLAEEDAPLSVSEKHLLAAVGRDVKTLEKARALALEELAADLAAGESHAITALEILEGATRKAR